MAGEAAGNSRAPADLGLLVSILHTADAWTWRNVGRSLRRLRPRWSSLAVDLWRRTNSSAADARLAVLTQHASVLALFSRVLFFDAAPREHVNSHVRPSFSYRMHWHSSFADPVSRWSFGLHSEGLPTLLAGVDADVLVPHNLPLARIASVLEEAKLASTRSVHEAEARARQVWLHGNVPQCVAEDGKKRSSAALHTSYSSSSSSFSSTSSAAALRSSESMAQSPSSSSGIPEHAPLAVASPMASPCEVVSERHAPLYVSPRNLEDLKVERRTSYAELGMYFSSLGLGNCCGRQNVNVPSALQAASGASVATLSRGPWCPPSTFFVVHKRSLDRLLTSFRLWQGAWDAKALSRDQKRMRWEFTSCALLAPGEAVLALYFNHSQLNTQPSRATQSGST